MPTKLPIATPSMRAKAHAEGVDLQAEAKSQPGGFVRSLNASPAIALDSYPARESLGAGTAIALSKIEKLTAVNLSASQRIPCVTHHDAVDTRALDAFRTELRELDNHKVSALSLQVMALAKTLIAFPRFNASLTDDGASLWMKSDVNIGIAVDTPHGLMVPVINNADRLGLQQIGQSIASLAASARDRKLRPEQMQGAGMSISNLGGIGGRTFNPMINPPEVAILGVMRTRLEPLWDGEAFVPVPMCPLALSYDHRVVNGADAQRFLNHFIELLADPRRLLCCN